jgi:hypothetical protein
MSHIKNFKDWFRVYESAGFKYRPGMAIFEEEEEAGTQVNPSMPQPLEPGAKIDPAMDWVYKDNKPSLSEALFSKAAHNKSLISNFTKIPKFYILSPGSDTLQLLISRSD